jgi:hypothetical protein
VYLSPSIVTTIVPDSDRLRAELEALPEEKKRAIRAKRHPYLARRMLILRSVTVEGAAVVAELVGRHGECWWDAGRWRVARVQLRLPGF